MKYVYERENTSGKGQKKFKNINLKDQPLTTTMSRSVGLAGLDWSISDRFIEVIPLFIDMAIE